MDGDGISGFHGQNTIQWRLVIEVHEILGIYLPVQAVY